MNTALLISLFFIGIAIIIAALYVLLKKFIPKSEEKKEDQAMLMLQSQLTELKRSNDELTKTIDAKLGQSTEMFQRQFGETHKIVSDVTEKLTRLDETNKQVVSFADQLQSLQDIFKNPKQRGIIGEYYLETLLKNVLPPGSYQMQYPFGDGTIVDAIVRVKDKIIPIDSKFSLENYNRIVEEKSEGERARLEKLFVNDLKTRITETAKYIQPAQGTMDFAFMFIPHEAIYYDLLINKIGALKDEDTENFIQRAASKYKVIIVSPTSFLAYLQTVLQGLKAMQIEETAQQIIKNVAELGKHIDVYEDHIKKLGGHLGTTVNAFNASYKELKKIDKDVMRIAGKEASAGIEPMVLERPNSGE